MRPTYSLSLVFLALVLFQCKSEKSNQTETSNHQLLILLNDKTTLSEVSALESKTFTSKKTSRTQNLWLLTFENSSIKKTELMDELKNDDLIIQVSDGDSVDSKDMKIKPGKSKPIKN